MKRIADQILALLFLITSHVAVAASEPHAKTPHTEATVDSIVDGDTLRVRIKGRSDSVRLIGIDTPESRFNKRAALQAERSNKDMKTILSLGKEAFSTLRTLAPKGSPIRLEFDVERRDKYDRLLAYVYRPDGVMLNEEMLSRGYAQLLTMPPNVRYVDRFTKALRKSQTERRGLWADGGFRN